MNLENEKILSQIQPIFEKYKNKEYIIKQPNHTRNIKILICGYNESSKDLLLIGKIDDKSGISGFNSKSSFDFIRNFSEKENYIYINSKRIEEAERISNLPKSNIKRKLMK